MKTKRYFASSRSSRARRTRDGISADANTTGTVRKMGRGRRTSRRRRQAPMKDQAYPYIQGGTVGQTQRPGIGNLRSNYHDEGTEAVVPGLNQVPIADNFDLFTVTNSALATNTDRTIAAAMSADDNYSYANKTVINLFLKLLVGGLNNIFPAGFDGKTTKEMVIDSGQFTLYKGGATVRRPIDSFPLSAMVKDCSGQYGVDVSFTPPQGLWGIYSFEIVFSGLIPSDDPTGYDVLPKLLVTYD